MRAANNRRGGFTLVEILVATLLLSGSLLVIMKLWSVSRSITEKSRDTAEYYVVARREVERDKGSLYRPIFILGNSPYNTGTTYTDYDEKGQPLSSITAASNLAAALAAPVSNQSVYYRGVSVYTRVRTGSETAESRQLGIQRVRVYKKNGVGFGTQVYETTVFYTAPGV